ncbi:restriction endonuclease subunit S [Rhodovulum steppense]|uniref:Type I restriction enzyme S subunit n=1 Tax=Rhodovulum steppense TaxID=540251 RepID=A0A4R1YN81_9RHOB|nr:restriction endonuclease subunit S [Rhodovulum steppense]TCM79256.1 type I restriction enzyme S subunit [Rhodovulum steppense]
MPLAEVATVINGGTPKSKVAEYWGGDIQWLTPKDMGRMDGREIGETPRRISESGLCNSSARLVPARSVILSTRAPIGHLAVNTVPMAFNQGCRGLVPGESLDHLYLYYFLLANRALLESLGTGTTFKELSSSNLKSVKIPLPPLEDQRRIVAVLDEAFVGLARARAHAEANLADARELFSNTLSHEFWKESGNWPAKSISEIAENLDRLRVPITKKDRNPGSIPYYGASGVVDHVADFIFDQDLLLVSEDGANLLARTYPIAFSISGKSWVNNHAHVLRFADLDSQEYVRLYLNAISLEPYVSGMAQPKLNQKALNRIPIPWPTPETRSAIVAKAAWLSSRTEELHQHYSGKIVHLDALRQSLLQKAFSGGLT